MATAKLPITNYVNGAPEGDYVAKIEIGPGKSPAYVILDTGSSTLAVWNDKFGKEPTKATTEVQYVGYGTGHWAGPVLNAQVGMGDGPHYIDVPDANIAQIQSGMYRGRRQFAPSDGIMGLAYVSLNTAADVGTTDFPVANYDNQQKWMAVEQKYGVKPVMPFFTQLEKAGLTPNKFAFLTRRSIPNQSADPATDPLNQGWFVLGGGEEHKELYIGDFQAVKEVDDPKGLGRYYNSNLTGVQVGSDGEGHVPASDPRSGTLSNSIIDSGTNSLALAGNVYQFVLQELERSAPNARPTSAADLAQWPTIHFTFDGVDGDVTLEVSPENYWQLNCTPQGQAQFNISNSKMGQSILGLPLMNGYYVVFDRSGTDTPSAGTIKFATQNPAGYPK